MRVLEGEEEAALRALVGPHVDDALAVEQDVAPGDLVGGMAHERVGERGLAGAVRAHDRVDLVRIHSEVDPADDLGAVLVATCRFLISSRAKFVTPLLGLSWPLGLLVTVTSV